MSVDELVVSRAELVGLAERARAGESVAEGEPSALRAIAHVLAAPRLELRVTVVRPGDVRRVSLWSSEVGVVAQADQEDEQTPGTVVATAPGRAIRVCLASLPLPLPAPAPAGAPAVARAGGRSLRALYAVVAAADPGPGSPGLLVVLDWSWRRGRRRRWVLADLGAGLCGDLGAPADGDGPLSLQPVTPMATLAELAGALARATSPAAGGGADDDEGTQP
jgi:hypothetical protein